MLKLLQAFLLVSCLAATAVAGPVTVSLRAGSSIPDLRDNGGNDVSKGWSSRLAPFFGLSADVGITPAFSLEADVNYAAQGGKRNGMQPIPFAAPPELQQIVGNSLVYAELNTTAKLDYIEVPVLAKYHFGLAHRFYVGAGPYAGFLVSAKTDASGPGILYWTTPEGQMQFPAGAINTTADNKSDLHVFNWGIQGGTGYQQPLGAGILSFEVRGGLGLANIQKDTATNGKNSTGVLVIAVGYGRRFGG